MRSKMWVSCICFCLISAGLLGASVVNSGDVHVTRPLVPLGTFNFSGSNFSVNGEFVSGNWQPFTCSPCTVGTVLSTDGTVIGIDFGDGSATINGMNFPSVNWGFIDALGPSIFTMTGPDVLVTGPGTYSANFSFTGALCGMLDNSGTCVADLPSLSGSGIVTFNIAETVGDLLTATDLTYTFTPEPCSIVLLGSGLLGVLALLRRRLLM